MQFSVPQEPTKESQARLSILQEVVQEKYDDLELEDALVQFNLTKAKLTDVLLIYGPEIKPARYREHIMYPRTEKFYDVLQIAELKKFLQAAILGRWRCRRSKDNSSDFVSREIIRIAQKIYWYQIYENK
jgi:hypothetical protein